MIMLPNIGYVILTTKNRFHQRSVEIRKRSNSKNAQEPNFRHEFSYDISDPHMTLNLIRGHHRSLKVNKKSHLKMHPETRCLVGILI